MNTVTLMAGYGYKVNQDFWRLTEDTQATLVARQPNGDLYVKLPESCKFAKQGNALFPRTAELNWNQAQ